MPEETTIRQGSGRKKIDWVAARTYYLELGPTRTATAVAAKFNVSPQGVYKQMRKNAWKTDAYAFDQEVQRRQEQAALRTRTNRRVKVLTIIDDVIDAFGGKATEKGKEASASDFAALVKLAELLEGEPTDRVQVGEVQQMVGVILSGVSVFIASDKRGDFLEWLAGVKAQLSIEAIAE